MPKHFFFDLDNTLTRSRSHITPEHAVILKTLSERAHVIVVSGATRAQQALQLEPELANGYFSLGQNGNSALAPDGSPLWDRKLSTTQKSAVIGLISKMKDHLQLVVKDEHDLIEDRGSQISYSLIGHHEDIAKKEAFDPDHAKRLELLRIFESDVQKLSEEHAIEIRSGGTTCLDIFEKGKNKGFNCKALIERMNWREEDCLYIGDALFPGGNDETVIGIIPTRAVQNPQETFSYLASVLS